MKTILFAAMTVNGFIARYSGEFPDYWSKEDLDFFIEATKKAGNVIMGRKTWDAIPEERKPLAGRFALIFTRKEINDKNVPGKFEYWGKSPKEAIGSLSSKGFETICVIGGGEINALFMKEGLIDELFITIEPMIFGRGVPLFAEAGFEKNLELLGCRQLNKNSINLHYRVAR